jgi:hypothetical protein
MDTQSLEITTDEVLGMEARRSSSDAPSNTLYSLYLVALTTIKSSRTRPDRVNIP